MLYKHYKGGLYNLMFEATHSETAEEMAVYRAVESRKAWVRPSKMFFDKVTLASGVVVPRFKVSNPFTCIDCNGNSDAYMVHNSVWNLAVPEDQKMGGAFVCLKCLELRLKRPLVAEDFTDKPINEPIRFGLLLAVRMALKNNKEG